MKTEFLTGRRLLVAIVGLVGFLVGLTSGQIVVGVGLPRGIMPSVILGLVLGAIMAGDMVASWFWGYSDSPKKDAWTCLIAGVTAGISIGVSTGVYAKMAVSAIVGGITAAISCACVAGGLFIIYVIVRLQRQS